MGRFVVCIWMGMEWRRIAWGWCSILFKKHIAIEKKEI